MASAQGLMGPSQLGSTRPSLCEDGEICALRNVVNFEHDKPVAYPGTFFRGGGSTNSVEDRGQRTGIWGRQPLVRGSGGSCNLVQEISFHIVKLSEFLVL
jgi:hypothetical protein